MERTQLDPDKSPCRWIGGDTYPHRAAFKAAAGRWSRKRKQWYFIGETLPQAASELIEQANAPASDKTVTTADMPAETENEAVATTANGLRQFAAITSPPPICGASRITNWRCNLTGPPLQRICAR